MLLRKLGIISGLALTLSVGMFIGGVTEPISEDDIAAWDIDIETESGAGLPPGSGTVAQGKELYTAQCVACHWSAVSVRL